MPAKKKDASVRQRRNKAVSRATLPLTAVADDAIPELPPRWDSEGNLLPWHEMVQWWWRETWTSPMASQYHSSDRHALQRIALLMETYWVKPTATAAEVLDRALAKFGQTPYDRLRLEWSFEVTDEAKDRGERRRTSQGVRQPSRKSDPRAALQLVQ